MRSLPFVERSELAGWGAVWTVVFIIATVVSFLGGAARDNGLPADRGGEPLFASTGKIGAAERPATKKSGAGGVRAVWLALVSTALMFGTLVVFA